MQSVIRMLVAIAATSLAAPAFAVLSIFATVPEWGALAQELGGDKVSVYTATNALQDPHHIEAKPSLIARARKADLVVATGAELEIGWLPLVLQQAGNGKVQPGKPGYFESTSFVTTIERPTRLDRAEGDVHPQGNPHIQTDPRNIARVAAALSQRMADLDPEDAAFFRQRYADFDTRWRASIVRWEAAAVPLRGVPVLVQHKAFSYLIAWLGMKETGTLEPKPGVDPTAASLSEILAEQERHPAKMVLRAAYQNDRPSLWIAERAHIPAVALPFTVGGDSAARDLTGLFDDTIARLLGALQ
ncbi:MAG TPA: zinc ABC transporter substrate-binding protein [Casimicrobiaceae bacterium]|nr:zinc ABC transporter substrate-binding protein [Casimicrobiaceae bacterium]